ncbi:hypothetical protein [Flavobacterium sp. RS13.1]|uniref:hypothetical protein n=1 Tax=Flavobacterium sp. RS13.1 TaxID=3400345 RepID=UPI003AAC8FBD
MKKNFIYLIISILNIININAQSLTELQMQNARATGYAIVAAKNPGKKFSIYMIKWDGLNNLEYNATNQINYAWHPQAVIKGNYFDQPFTDNSFSLYSSVILSQDEFDIYKSTGTDWWIVCSTLPSFNNSGPYISDTGNIGIGTSAPDEKLTVKGKIHTQEVRVDLLGPLVPDYVFSNDYKLKSLEEVEDYIKQNSHLPEIPSAKEIEKNGLMLAEMNMSLLKKIEELTLYSIEQNKKIEAQSKEIKNQSKEIETLKDLVLRVAKIENDLAKK